MNIKTDRCYSGDPQQAGQYICVCNKIVRSGEACKKISYKHNHCNLTGCVKAFYFNCRCWILKSVGFVFFHSVFYYLYSQFSMSVIHDSHVSPVFLVVSVRLFIITEFTDVDVPSGISAVAILPTALMT